MRHTLRLLKDTFVYTGPQGLVEERVEHVVGDSDLVVGSDILLELLTAMRQLVSYATRRPALNTSVGQEEM